MRMKMRRMMMKMRRMMMRMLLGVSWRWSL
jgi:hypothetical protein